MFNFNFFKRKPKLTTKSLEEAKDLGLITEEEFLRLKEHRASEQLEIFLKNKKSKK